MKIKIITNVVLVFIFLAMFVYAESDNLVYSLTLGYDGKSLTNERLRIIEGIAPERVDQPETGFTLKVIDFNGNTLYSFKFLIEMVPRYAPPREIFSENGTQIAVPNETLPKPTQTQEVLVIPYFKNGKSIDIFNEDNQLLLSVDTSKYSQRTGTGLDSILIGSIITLIVIIFIVLFYLKNKFLKTKKLKMHFF